MNYRLSKDGLGNMGGNNFKALSQRMIELNPARPWANEVTYKFGK
jgi:hypothetical protein